MFSGEYGYLNLLSHIKMAGKDRGDRTGTGTRSVFSAQIEFDLQDQFSLLTTKKMATKAIFGELLWFLSGSQDLKSLRQLTFGDPESTKKTIWDDNIKSYSDTGNGGALYGVQWRDFSASSGEMIFVDQIESLLDEARRNPESRRLLVNAWNAAEIADERMALPPCHFAFQVYIEDGYLNLKWNQRSVDCFLGLPFNIASYATLTHLLAHWLGYKPGKLVGDLTNVHIYHNHFDAVDEQLNRTPLECKPKLVIPEDITLQGVTDLDYTAADFLVEGYDSHGPIKAPMAV